MLAGQTVGLQTWVNHLLTRRDGKLWPQPERQVCSSKPLRFMDVLKFTSDDLSQNMIVNRETHSEGEYFIFKVYYWGHCCWLFWTRWSRFQKSVFGHNVWNLVFLSTNSVNTENGVSEYLHPGRSSQRAQFSIYRRAKRIEKALI